MDNENNAKLEVETVDYGLTAALSMGAMLSIEKSEEFEEIVSRSIDREIVKPVIAEIRARREKLRVKHVLASFLAFVVLGLFAYCLFPRIPTTRVDDAWGELNVSPLHYETEDSLRKSINLMLSSPPPTRRKMSKGERECVFKYRTVNVRKTPSDYLKDFDGYIGMLSCLANQYEDVELKECFVEGVLSSFPRDETSIGLECYVMEVKRKGDSRCIDRYDRVSQSLDCCDDVLAALQGHKDDTKKVLSVKLQKAQLLMYRWILENVKKSNGGPVKSFPDDKDDLGVADRELAVKIIHEEDVWKVPEGKELYNQCIDILINDSSLSNWIYFGGENYYRHQTLWNRRFK